MKKPFPRRSINHLEIPLSCPNRDRKRTKIELSNMKLVFDVYPKNIHTYNEHMALQCHYTAQVEQSHQILP